MVARTVSSDLRILALSVIWLVVSVVPTAADDLSRYRGFQLGMSLSAVAQQAELDAQFPGEDQVLGDVAEFPVRAHGGLSE